MSGTYVSKFTAERNQRILLDLVSKPGNDVCADCQARAPRWASHNLGIFVCMNCASIHRKIGTHITKVKSVTMDSWSKEQIEVMKSIGNVASNSKYNPDESRHPPPTNREESERDSELEKFIRWKYEFKRFMDKPGGGTPVSSTRASAPVLPPPYVRPRSTPVASMERRSSPLPPVPTSSASHPITLTRPSETHSIPTASLVALPRQPSALRQVPASMASPAAPAPTSAPVSFPVSVVPTSVPASTPVQAPAPAPAPALRPEPSQVSKHPVWGDMMSLANPVQPGLSATHHPQLQLQATAHFQPQPQSYTSPGSSTTNTFSATPTNSFPTTMINHQIPSRSVSLPVFQSTSSPFPTQNTQPQLNVGNPFSQQFPSQMPLNGTPFQPSISLPAQVQSPFGQLQSPLSQSYTPSAFPQQQQFTPSSYPQQYEQASHIQMQQPLQVFPQQPPMQGGGNPYSTPMWQQQHSGQPPPYGTWGGM